jgi:hypothetical protein
MEERRAGGHVPRCEQIAKLTGGFVIQCPKKGHRPQGFHFHRKWEIAQLVIPVSLLSK